jgi:hypothetical protein
MSRARRVPVDEPLVDAARADYADAFEIEAPTSDPRSAEEWVRAGLEQSPLALRRTILIAHRHVLRLQLGPLDAPGHVLGWRITSQERDTVRLEASGTLADPVIVGRRDGDRVVLTTAIRYRRPRLARAVWTCVGPLHRRIAPYLLERAAVRAPAAR